MGKIERALERAKGMADTPRRRASDARAAQAVREEPRTEEHLHIEKLRRVPVDWEQLRDNRIVTYEGQVKHSAQSAYLMLRTRLMKIMRSNNWQILGVSSMSQDEGKTFTSINLAASIAAEIGQEAVLVDLDLRRPSICSTMGIEPTAFSGLPEYLQGREDDLRKLVFCPTIDRLGCLLSATSLERSSDLLASPRGKELFHELRHRLPPKAVAIVDLPPILVADDALAIAPMLDALVLVVAAGESERREIAGAKHLLGDFNIIGVVLNKSQEKDGRAQYY